MTHRHAVLVRGINVGTAKRVSMAAFRELLERLGFERVGTLLQSGNAIFDAPEPSSAAVAERVESALFDELGVRARCIGVDLGFVDRVIAGDPFGDIVTDGSRYQVLFLSGELPRLLLENDNPADLDPANVRLGSRVVYQWCPDGLLAAPAVGDHVMKRTDLFFTARNWNTVRKLRDRLAV